MWVERNCLSFETAAGGIEPPSPQLTLLCDHRPHNLHNIIKNKDSWKQFCYDVNGGTLIVNHTVYCIPGLCSLPLQTSVFFSHDYTN